jgi:hypothetical protein
VGDRFGPRLTLFACAVIWATATILAGFARPGMRHDPEHRHARALTAIFPP